MDFEQAVTIIIDLEGGATVTEDPRDPGGLTKYGISLNAHPELGREGLLNLTLEQAKAVYKRAYWTPTRCDDLPKQLRLCVFDSAVNQGVKAAIETLQRTLKVTPDGQLGPVTLRAAQNSPADGASYFLTERAFSYQRLPTFKTYGRGWIRRLFVVSQLG